MGKDEYQARKAVVIATGSRVKGIPQIGLEIDKTTVISSDEALFLEKHRPRRMTIIGAGAVGCEFADIFTAFGTKVTLIEALPRILPMEDVGIVRRPDQELQEARDRGAGRRQSQEGHCSKGQDDARGREQGKSENVEAEKVLMAAGRAVNTENLGLQEAGVQLTERGFIKVNLATLETSTAGVYAIGDVAGPPMLAHKGSREGVVVAELIAGHHPQPIKYDNVPSVTYCHPEVASIGHDRGSSEGAKARLSGWALSLQRQRPGADRGRNRRICKDHPGQEVW